MHKEKFNLLEKVEETIKNEEISKDVYAALEEADDKFWTDPCSGTGKYHPPEDQGKGGIVRHILKGLVVVDELSRYYVLPPIEKECAFASWFLHDMHKNGIPWLEKTDYTHGLITYNFLDKFKFKDKLVKDVIRNAVRYHMYRWCMPESEVERAMKPNKIENIIQLTDLITSRKGISFMPYVACPGFFYPEEEDTIKK